MIFVKRIKLAHDALVHFLLVGRGAAIPKLAQYVGIAADCLRRLLKDRKDAGRA